MAQENAEEGQQEVKSLDDNFPSFISFHSRIIRPVELLWVNYEGKVVNFRRMQFVSTFHVETFVTHPWIVWDAETHQRYLLNGKPIHYPSPFDPNEPVKLVNLDIPVYSLKEGALRALRCYIDINSDNLEQLELPKTVLNELKSPQPPGFQYASS